MKRPIRRVVFVPLFCLGLTMTIGIRAQSSTNYQNREHVVNSGGNPAPTLTSTDYRITLSSIGDGLTATGMSSASYQLDGGFVPSYLPPDEVLNLLFSDATTLTWDPEPSVGDYDVYRGNVAELSGGGYGACLVSGVTATEAEDTSTPAPGQCFFYIVTARNRIVEEGTMGSNSSGTGRSNSTPCS